MDLAAYRKFRGLTQQQTATELGLRSKGYVSVLERGEEFASIRLALKIQRWSGGAVAARSMVSPDQAELLPPELTPAPEAHA